MNVTATGIAVAAAVIVAIGLMFFGPQIFTVFTHSAASLTSTSTSSPMQESSQQPASSAPNANGLEPTIGSPQIPQNVTQLMMADQTIGTGAIAQAGDQVTVQYVGELTNGTVFDASSEHGTQGFTFTLGAGQVIKGWDEGVVGMKVGGIRELVIPPSLGYGSQAVGPIPANSVLVFKVELINVQAPAQGSAAGGAAQASAQQ